MKRDYDTIVLAWAGSAAALYWLARRIGGGARAGAVQPGHHLGASQITHASSAGSITRHTA
jgi:hypothetical protein